MQNINVGTVGHVDYGDDQKIGGFVTGGVPISRVIVNKYVEFEDDYQEIIKHTGHKKPFYQKGRW